MSKNKIPVADDMIWIVADPAGREVALKKATFDFHIAGADHDEKAGDFRGKIANQAALTIISPDFVVKDGTRNIYFGLVKVPHEMRLLKIKPMKVVVDADKKPNEVVTWTVMRKMTENFKPEAITYERQSNDEISHSTL